MGELLNLKTVQWHHLNLEEDNVGAVLMGEGHEIREVRVPLLPGELPRCQWEQLGRES